MNRTLVSLALGAVAATAAVAQDTQLDQRFAYQGELRDGGVIVDGLADFTFALFDQPTGGNQLGTTQTVPNVEVTAGVFSVPVPFDDPVTFSGAKRYLEVTVRHPAGAGAYTPMTPRVELLPTPYAHHAERAAFAFDADAVGGAGLADLVQKGEAASITAGMIAPHSILNGDVAFDTLDASKIATDLVSSIDGVTNDGGDIDLVAGPGIAISPDDNANAITITATGSGGDAGTLDGLHPSQFLRSDSSDTYIGAFLTMGLGTTLNVQGALVTNGSIDVADGTTLTVGGTTADLTIGGSNLTLNLGDSADDDTIVSGDLDVGTDLTADDVHLRPGGSVWFENDTESLSWDATDSRFELSDTLHLSGTLDVGGTTTVPYNRIGPADSPWSAISGPDDLYVTGKIGAQNVYTALLQTGGILFTNFLGPTSSLGYNSTDDLIEVDVPLRLLEKLRLRPAASGDGDTNIYFKDGGNELANYIRWDDVYTPNGSCNGEVNSGFVWNIQDNLDSGWLLANGSDAEFHVDELGNVAADGTIGTGVACDLAELFLGDPELPAGTLVRVDVSLAEAVEPTTAPYDLALAGVVSTHAGLLLGGPTADAYAVRDELDRVRDAWRASPEDEELARAAENLERALDDWTRGEVPVALAGRVPVRVVGPVRAGEPLTSSGVAGHAMAMRRPGPSVGIALDSKDGAGHGTVLVLVQPAWRSPLVVEEAEPAREHEVVADAPPTRIDDVADRAAERVADPAARTVDGARPIVRIERQVFGDLDGDTRRDVVLINPGGGLRVLRGLGHGRFEGVEIEGIQSSDALDDAHVLDADGDGALDLVLIGTDGRARVLAGDGSFRFTDVTHKIDLPTSLVTESDAETRIAALEAQLAELTALVDQLTGPAEAHRSGRSDR